MNPPAEKDENMKFSMEDVHPVASYREGEMIEKPFTTLSALSLAYNVTNSAIAVLLSLGTQIYFGGGPAFLYGYIAMALVGVGVAISLGELTSAFPHSGGQYFWVSQLCDEKTRRFASYITAIFAWAGAVTTGASVTLAASQIIFGMVKMMHPGFEEHPWMIFVCYLAMTALTFPFNVFEKPLPYIAKGLMAFTILSLITIFIALFAAAPAHQSASFVFKEFQNSSGWTNGVAFFIGLNSPNWCFSCLDAATHLCDEISEPRNNVPKALLLTIAVGFGTGVPIILAIFFCVQDLDGVINGVSGVASMEVFYQAFSGNRSAAVGLQSLILISSFGCVIGIHTWQMRLAWAFSRDHGFPFSRQLAKVLPRPFATPLGAHVWSCTWTILCGLLYLASTAAFASLVSAGILLQYITYSTAIGLLLWRGRQNITPGPFWYPRLGLFCNVVVLLWTAVALVFYSLPYYRPVLADEMNYVSVVLVAILLYAAGYWYCYGKKAFRPAFQLVDTN